MNVDQAFAAFELIRAQVEPLMLFVETEQDARLQLINRLLIEVLGWQYPDIKTEPHSESGFTDYLLSISDHPAFVVEAKRTAQPLLDTTAQKATAYKVSGPALRSAASGVRQAAGYCLDHGVDFAALTTGLVWIGFLAFPFGGKSYRDGKAIVFPSLDAVRDDFASFYDLFAKKSVAQKDYKIRFARAEGLATASFDPLVAVNRPAELRMLPRTTLAQDLDPIFKEFFGAMSGERDRDMLLHCFVESRESRSADAALQKLIGNISGSVDTISTQTGRQLANRIEDALQTRKGENILIVGNKGAGKSTFVDRFFKLILSPQMQASCLVVKIDFLDSPGDAAKISDWLNTRVKTVLENLLFNNGIATYDELQGMYYREYQKWREGQFKPLYDTNKNAFKIRFGEFLDSQINGNPHDHILRILEDVVRNRKLLPCLIFDNTDHYSEAFQEAVFQWSQAIRQATPFSIVIIPITDRTIWRLSKSGPFQTYHSRLFYLPVPSTKEVLEKRISFLSQNALKADGSRSYFLSRGIRLSVQNIQAFAACTEEIFIREDFISRRISWLSNHDIRRGLLLSQSVMTSPFLSIDLLVAAYLSRGTMQSKLVKLQEVHAGTYIA